MIMVVARGCSRLKGLGFAGVLKMENHEHRHCLIMLFWSHSTTLSSHKQPSSIPSHTHALHLPPGQHAAPLAGNALQGSIPVATSGGKERAAISLVQLYDGASLRA